MSAPHQLANRVAELAAVQAPAAVGVEDPPMRPHRGENNDFGSVSVGSLLLLSVEDLPFTVSQVTRRIRGASGVVEVLNLPTYALLRLKWDNASLYHLGSCATVTRCRGQDCDV